MSAQGEISSSNERLNWVLRSSGNGETKKGWTSWWGGYLKMTVHLALKDGALSGRKDKISVENRRGTPMKGTAWTEARKPSTHCKGDLARVERRNVLCREGINIWREGNRQPWRDFQSDLRKMNMTALLCSKWEKGKQMPPRMLFTILDQTVFPKWETEKRYYGIEIGQTFLIYLGLWDEGVGWSQFRMPYNRGRVLW